MLALLSPVLSLAKGVPVLVWVIAAVLVWGGYQRHSANSAKDAALKQQAEIAVQNEKALQESIAETQRRVIAQTKVVQDAKVREKTRLDQSASAVRAGDGLRARISPWGQSPPAGSSSAPSGSQTKRLADALVTCADQYRAVAEVADRAVARGLACEQAYGSLSQPAKE